MSFLLLSVDHIITIHDEVLEPSELHPFSVFLWPINSWRTVLLPLNLVKEPSHADVEVVRPERRVIDPLAFLELF